MKKKLFAAIAIVLFATTFSFAKKAKQPKATPAKYFSYETTDDGKGIRITGYKSDSKNNIIIPETIDKKPVTEIGGSRFFSEKGTCPSITIPASVTVIGDNVFSKFDVLRGEGGEVNYGEFIFKDFSKIKVFGNYAFLFTESFNEKITVTSDMSIGEAAFDGSGITEIVFEGNPKSLGKDAFQGCKNLKSVTFLTDMELPKDVFFGCTSLTDVKVGEDVIITELNEENENIEVTNASEIFGDCPLSDESKLALKHAGVQEFASIKEPPESPRTEPNPASDFEYELDADGKGVKITSFKADSGYAFIPDTIDGKPVTTIGSTAFKGAYTVYTIQWQLEELEASDKKKKNEYALYIIKNGTKKQRFRELLSVTIPATVTTIEKSAFSNFYGKVEFKDFNNLKNIGDSAFHNGGGLNGKLTITEDMTIGEEAFSGTGISEVVFEENPVSLGNWAFSSCRIESVTFCNNVVLPTGVFSGCRALSGKITVTEGMVIGERAFSRTGISEVDFETSTVLLGETFSSCNNLTNVNIGDGVKVTTTDFSFSDFPENVSDASKLALKNAGYYDVIIPSGTTSIYRNYNNSSDGSKDFRITDLTCEKANLIKIPASVVEIGDSAFSGYNGKLEFENVANIKKIGADAFSNCSALNGKLTVTDGMTIGKGAFSGSEITEVIFEGTPASLGNCTFSESLKSVTFLASVELPYNIFNGCKSLSDIKVADSVKVKDKYNVFSDCPLTNESKFALKCAGVEEFADALNPFAVASSGADFKCEPVNGNVEALIITEYIEEAATVIIPDTIEGYPVTEIGSNAFENRRSVTSVTIPASVTHLGGAFSGMDCDVIFNDFNNIKEIWDGAFAGFKGRILLAGGTPLTAEILSNSNVEYFGVSCFADYKALTGKLTLTNKVKSIGIAAFRGSGITEVVFDGCSGGGDATFEECESLESVLIKKDTTLGRSGFASCESLKKVEFADGVHLYGYYVEGVDDATFKSCKNLTDVVVGKSVKLYNNYSYYSLEGQFYDCPNLSIKSKMAIHNLDEKSSSY